MRIGVTCQDHNRPMPLCLWAACACACGLLELPRASIRGQHSNTPSFSDCKLTKKYAGIWVFVPSKIKIPTCMNDVSKTKVRMRNRASCYL